MANRQSCLTAKRNAEERLAWQAPDRRMRYICVELKGVTVD
jgi:hypothetical protein